MYENTINPKAPTKHLPSNFVEQELHGIRVKSLVDFNNPLLYGSDVPRIASRSTRTLEIMKEGRQITNGDHGLIGKGLTAITGGNLNSINEVRNKIGDFLGLPQPLLPTVVAGKLEPGVSVQDILDQKNGTEVGKLLKESVIGGNPKTIVKQSLGTAIKFGKDLLRKTLFGMPAELQQNFGDDYDDVYTDITNYTKVQKDIGYKDPVEDIDEFAQKYHINLQTSSPIYGVDRYSKMWDSDLGTRIRKDKDTIPSLAKELQPYDVHNTYSGTDDNKSPVAINSLENKYKLSSNEDGINLYSENADTKLSTEELEDMDLIPFWIGYKGATTKTHFRALLSGISETVSPNWSENSFFGNPFAFYTYGGVGREVTFSLLIYCSNPVELAVNWEKVNTLTKYTYPAFEKSKQEGSVVKPPIIDFRIGDIYKDKTGYISSLSYTFPDNGTWETDKKIGLLPKFIEVSVSIHFIEQVGDGVDNLYGYDLSPEAVKLQNDKNGSQAFNTKFNLSSNGTPVTKPPKVTTKGLASFKPNLVGDIKDLSGNTNIPPVADLGALFNPKAAESAVLGKVNMNPITLEMNSTQLSTVKHTLLPQGYIQKKVNGLELQPGQFSFVNEEEMKAKILHVNGVATRVKLETPVGDGNFTKDVANLFK